MIFQFYVVVPQLKSYHGLDKHFSSEPENTEKLNISQNEAESKEPVEIVITKSENERAQNEKYHDVVPILVNKEIP